MVVGKPADLAGWGRACRGRLVDWGALLTPGPNRDETRAVFEWLPPDVELITDLGPAEWFSSTLEPWGRHRLASFMPDGYESYVRIFHPFELWGGGTTTYRSWSDVAAERGVS